MTGETVRRLRETFGIPGVLAFEAGASALARAVVTTPDAEAHVYLHGAHVTHYQRRGDRPVLFLSPRSAFAAGHAIRGGVPVVFPWFGPRAGDPSAPDHGLARTAAWTLEAAAQGPGGEVTLVVALAPTTAMASRWPEGALVRYQVVVGATLTMALEVSNTSDRPFRHEQALHTYLAVSDVREVSLSGLAGVTYIDKTDAMRRKVQEDGPLRVTGETDRVYLDTRAACVVDDPLTGRRIRVDKEGSASTVVWNPWAVKAAALADLGADAWTGFLCVETANVADNAVTLAAGARHELRAMVATEPRG
jgi:glucose-6-phosphate 1-epimerase